jgi:hypothetical protein
MSYFVEVRGAKTGWLSSAEYTSWNEAFKSLLKLIKDLDYVSAVMLNQEGKEIVSMRVVK